MNLKERGMPKRYGRRSETNRLVMEACANDYEEFSMMVSDIGKWTKGESNAPTIGELEEALVQSIANKDIDAFEEQEDGLRLTTLPPNHETIGTIWFYATEQGKKWVKEMCEIENNEVSTSKSI
jgi:hypothetical protein